MSHLVLVEALKLETLRALAVRASAAVDRLERAVPRAAPVVAWLRANRRDVAAAGCAVVGTLLIAAGGGLL